jgi:hypothetical protein
MTMKEKRTRTSHATQKGLEVVEKVNWVFFGDVNKQSSLVFGDATESIVYFVMLFDRWYVAMQMNWPFLVTGESQ